MSKKITYWQGDVCLNPYCSLHVQSWTQHWLWCVSAASGQFRLKRHLRWNCLLQSNAHVQQCEWLTEADVRPSLHFYVQQEKNSILWSISAPDAGLSVSFPSAMWFKQCSLTPTLSKSKRSSHTRTHAHTHWKQVHLWKKKNDCEIEYFVPVTAETHSYKIISKIHFAQLFLKLQYFYCQIHTQCICKLQIYIHIYLAVNIQTYIQSRMLSDIQRPRQEVFVFFFFNLI